jgi:hypothetical protein
VFSVKPVIRIDSVNVTEKYCNYACGGFAGHELRLALNQPGEDTIGYKLNLRTCPWMASIAGQ